MVNYKLCNRYLASRWVHCILLFCGLLPCIPRWQWGSLNYVSVIMAYQHTTLFQKEAGRASHRTNLTVVKGFTTINSTLPHSTPLFLILPNCTPLNSTVLHWLYCTPLYPLNPTELRDYCTPLTILYCTKLHCTPLYSTVLHWLYCTSLTLLYSIVVH